MPVRRTGKYLPSRAWLHAGARFGTSMLFRPNNVASYPQVLELMYAKKLARHRAMSGFLRAGVHAGGAAAAAAATEPGAAGKAGGKAQPADEEEEEGAAGVAAEPAADKMEVDGAVAMAVVKEGKGAAGPRRPSDVYWRPARHNAATLALKEQQEQQLKEWEVRACGGGKGERVC